ncbi:MAG: HDIG domain-containing protein [Candidatus Alcyoniella australis]|nr:HDIG domain-containing protein [Candidatus Alcyoniella australis]
MPPRRIRPFRADVKSRRQSRKAEKGLRRLWAKLRDVTPGDNSLSASTWLVGLGLSIYIALFLAPSTSVTVDLYEIGQYTTRAIKAPMPFSVEDDKATSAKREQARYAVLPVYDFDRNLVQQTRTKVDRAFVQMREFFAQYAPTPVVPQPGATPGATPTPVPQPRKIPPELLAEHYQQFNRQLGAVLDDDQLEILRKAGFSAELQQAIDKLISESYLGYIVSDRNFFDQTLLDVSRQAFSRREVESGKEKEISDFSSVLAVEEVKEGVQGRVKQEIPDASRRLRETIGALVVALIEPNLTFAKAETQTRKSEAARKIAPVVAKYEKNQLIIGEGELVTEETLLVLEALEASGPQSSFGLVFVGIASVFFILFTVLFGFVKNNVRKFRHGNRDILFLAALTMGLTLILWIGIAIAESITETGGTMPMAFFLMAIPVAMAPMLVRLILNSETALAYMPVAAMLAGMMADNSLYFGMYVLVCSFAGAWAVGKVSQRLDALKAGLLVSITGMLLVLSTSFLSTVQGMQFWKQLGFESAGAVLGGVLCALTVLALSPVIEWIFGYTTDIKLMELANLNHPLLKEMILKAPGTYNHSILVSTLAETAAESINANPLLAKVAALYHDIGKISKPHYFIENQRGGENPHDKLYPMMSGLILVNHVREGVELARDFNLGDAVAQIVEQHHGKGLIRFFYERARERTDPQMEQLHEEDFRYPGPKPRSREAALVMLADQVEAVSRVLKAPAPSRIRNLVSEHINRVSAEGQLDESDLTLRDLHKIAESFSHVLIGIFHQRIEYPDDEREENAPERESQSDTDPRPPNKSHQS